MSKYKEFDDVDLFDGVDAESESLDFLENKGSNLDGIYRPKITDKTKGYKAKIRFLPNLTKDGKVGPAAIEKHQHYVDLKNHPDLVGYYDCNKNFEDKCDICTMFWKLKNSNNATDVEKCDLINRNTKYYSYVLVVEDEQNKDFEGKILIYPYGYKIKEKIKDQRDGLAGDPCNVFDLANGKDFQLVMKQVGEFPNYDSSTFLPISPIKIQGKPAPVTVDEKTGKNKITNAKVKDKIREFLIERDVDLTDHMPKPWTDDDKFKVRQVLEVLNGNDINTTERKAAKSGDDELSTSEPDDENIFGSEPDDAGDFFDLDSTD
jgi:hypothetical protein